MKKNLLALFALGAICNSLNAQNTFINDAVVVKVNPNTLFYNGGSVTVSTPAVTGTTEKIINQGNIQVVGTFENKNTTGKNFVNKYVGNSSYGQLMIKNAVGVTGKVTMERSTPSLTNDEYVISLPFKGETAANVINSLNDGNFFKGECALNSPCGTKRYEQTLFVWDNKETEYDAIIPGDIIKPEQRYLLNLRSNSPLRTAISNLGTSPVKFIGTPNNDAINVDLKSGLKNGSQDYANLTWGQWKRFTNNYNEYYETVLGNQSNDYSGDLLFGKNLHRLGNPFTSNLDLSNVNTGASWITFTTTVGSNQSPAAAWGALRFRVFKIANDLTIKWNSTTGNNSSTGSNTPLSAYLMKNGAADSYFWVGSPEALLVRPYESFYVNYYAVNNSVNGSRIINANVKLGDDQKTFSNDYTPVGTAGNPPSTVYSRSSQQKTNNNTSSLLNNEELKAKGLVTDFDFTQLELYLSSKNNNSIEGNAAYLLNANFMTTGSTATKSSVENPVFFYEESENGTVLEDVQTLTNQFNSEDYIGKPLRVGFNNLNQGEQYRLNLNLYEYSILNKVNNLNIGKYYLLDKLTNKVTEVNGNIEVAFTADDKINDRFEFYWNESPKTLSTDDINKNNTTYLYTNNGGQFIKFEQSNTTADITVYDITGRQIFNKNAVVTSVDFPLNFSNVPSVYVVKITYKDGKTVTKKTINK